MSATSITPGNYPEDSKDLKVEVIHLEQRGEIDDNNTGDAISAEKAEHDQTIWNAVKNNRQAVLWSVVVSMCVVMESYDLQLVGNLMAQPAFKRTFGEYINPERGYEVSAPWQTGLTQAGTIGSFFGILLCGTLVERFGYKKTTLFGLVLMIAAVFFTFFASSPAVLLVGELACGVPWGFFINVAPAYASEIAPLKLRGILTIYVQICWCIGSFFCAGVLYGFNQGTTQWSYRIPFALQWVFPPFLIALIAFAPESPWWLVRKGRLSEAQASVIRLGGSANSDPANTIAMMVRTTELEAQTTAGASYAACFKGTDLRRTIIVSCMFAFQNFSGLLIGNQSSYFFQQAGIPTNSAFALSLGNTALQFTAVLFCWILVAYFGRRTLYLWGVGFNIVFLLATGITASVGKTEASMWLQAVFMIMIYAQYGLTIGPITYAVIAETSSIRLRAKSVGIARNFYYVVAITSGIINTYMLNPTAWNMKGKAAFVWAGTACLVWVSCYFFLPECKDRSFRELDILFHRKVPARQFATTVIDEKDEA